MNTETQLKYEIVNKTQMPGVIRIILLVVLVTVFGAMAGETDPARTIRRKCPIERMDTDAEYQQAVLDGPEWKGGKVRVIGECTYDAKAIKSWAEAQGIKCRIASTVAYVGRRKIANGHWTVIPDGSKYTIDYVANIGVVSRRIREEDDFVFVEKGENDHLMLASTSVVTLPGKLNPVRAVDFSVIPD
jgi:hypothetical protein